MNLIVGAIAFLLFCYLLVAMLGRVASQLITGITVDPRTGDIHPTFQSLIG